MADFLKAWKISQSNAGGYVNDPNDAGGETYRDISRVFNPKWVGWPIIDQIKAKSGPIPKNFTSDALDQLALAFYKQKFWNAVDLDNVTNQDNANQIFDETFDGQGRCVMMIKLILNDNFGTAFPVTATYTPDITTALNGADQKKFFDAFKDIRANHFKYSANDLPADDQYYSFFEKFGKPQASNSMYEKGWLNRVNKYVWTGPASSPEDSDTSDDDSGTPDKPNPLNTKMILPILFALATLFFLESAGKTKGKGKRSVKQRIINNKNALQSTLRNTSVRSQRA